MKRIALIALMALISMGVVFGYTSSPKYAPATEELTKEALVFSEVTHGALIDWRVASVEVVNAETLQELNLFDRLSESEVAAINYGEVVEYSKEKNELTVVVLEFADVNSAKGAFAKSKEEAISLGAVVSPEFGNEGYATGEKSSLPYIDSYRLGKFIVYVAAKEAGMYDVKMMARKIMKDILPYYEGEAFELGPLKISEFVLYPIMEAKNDGIYMKMLEIFVPKTWIVSFLIAMVFVGAFSFVVAILLVRKIYLMLKKE